MEARSGYSDVEVWRSGCLEGAVGMRTPKHEGTELWRRGALEV